MGLCSKKYTCFLWCRNKCRHFLKHKRYWRRVFNLSTRTRTLAYIPHLHLNSVAYLTCGFGTWPWGKDRSSCVFLAALLEAMSLICEVMSSPPWTPLYSWARLKVLVTWLWTVHSRYPGESLLTQFLSVLQRLQALYFVYLFIFIEKYVACLFLLVQEGNEWLLGNQLPISFLKQEGLLGKSSNVFSERMGLGQAYSILERLSLKQ